MNLHLPGIKPGLFYFNKLHAFAHESNIFICISLFAIEVKIAKITIVSCLIIANIRLYVQVNGNGKLFILVHKYLFNGKRKPEHQKDKRYSIFIQSMFKCPCVRGLYCSDLAISFHFAMAYIFFLIFLCDSKLNKI